MGLLISLSAKFNTRHYGHFSDLLQGVQNTSYLEMKTAVDQNGLPIDSQKTYTVGQNPAITSTFGQHGHTNIIEPFYTACSNIDPSSRIFSPYFDGEIPQNSIGREVYIAEDTYIAVGIGD